MTTWPNSGIRQRAAEVSTQLQAEDGLGQAVELFARHARSKTRPGAVHPAILPVLAQRGALITAGMPGPGRCWPAWRVWLLTGGG